METLELNWGQEEAFASAFAATPYHLIQGPPGTGKRLNVSITRAKTKLIVLSGLQFSLVAGHYGDERADLLNDFINNCDGVETE